MVVPLLALQSPALSLGPTFGFGWSHLWLRLVPLLASIGPTFGFGWSNPVLRTGRHRPGQTLGPLALSGGPTSGLAISGFKCRSHFWLRLVPPLASVGWSHFWLRLVPLLASIGPTFGFVVTVLRILAGRHRPGQTLGPLALSGGPTSGLAISGFKCRSHFWLRLVPPLASVGWSYFWLRSVLLLASVGPNPVLRILAGRHRPGQTLGPLALSGGPTSGLAISGFKCRSHFWLRLVPPLALVGPTFGFGWSQLCLREFWLVGRLDPVRPWEPWL